MSTVSQLAALNSPLARTVCAALTTESSVGSRAGSALASGAFEVDWSTVNTTSNSVATVAASFWSNCVFIILTGVDCVCLAREFALAVGNGGPGFLVCFSAAFCFALVPILLAFGHGQFALYLAVPEVKPGRDERMAFYLRLHQ